MSGKIFLVGFGPGAVEHMSARARDAIAASDVVIGYSTYIKLVADLLEGKEVVRKGMTEEIDRCIEAYEQAQMGKVVALVSSGDIGVYGMAGPTYEVLLKAGWRPQSGIEVEVVPGSTALSACASLVGAPLTHDFCSISLSDLLTPWPTIARRLEAAASSDFVVALYNPKSGRRTGQIIEAQRILLQYRKPDTPVAIVKSAYRDKQNIQMVRLDEMKDCKIGMLTTVLIGNSTTFMREGLMITPRGYANKYDDITGEALDGEKKGRSLSMGLDGWQACVRQKMRQDGSHSLRELASWFKVHSGDILEAISAADEQDVAGDYQGLAVDSADLQMLISETAAWGQLRAVVRSETGAVSELMISAHDLIVKGDWLNIENKHFHLHINWGKVAKAWLIRRHDQRTDVFCGVFFCDERNNSVFSLSLIRANGQFNDAARAGFERSWKQQAGAGE